MKIQATRFLFAALCMGSVVALPVSAMADDHRNDHRHEDNRGHDNRGHDDRGRDHRAPEHYEFRDQDRARLQRHYQRNLSHIDRGRRPQFVPGGYIAAPYRGYITPAPARVVGYLPPPPRGYSVGYYQGYTVVYDPATFLILNVIDLLAH